MAETCTRIRFFTIADFEEEEMWLRDQSREGWRLVGMTPPCIYNFERCEAEDVIYRLVYKNNEENPEFMQMVEDYGWERAGRCLGWLYFRKPVSEMENENDGEIFSDNASRIDMVRHIARTRLLPLAVIFLCCVIPNLVRATESSVSAFFSVFWILMFGIYVYLLVHCGFKLRRLRKELE